MEDSRVVFQGRVVPVSYFPDDSVDTVRQKIGGVLGIHPDRLFLEVELQCSKDAYENPRDWEALFFRLAEDSAAKSTSARLMRAYTTQTRTPAPRLELGVPREDWEGLVALRAPEEAFHERRILGVETPRSLVLPLPPDPEVAARISGARIPLPQRSRMFRSIHPEPVVRFHAAEVQAPANSAVRNLYAPYWTPETPETVPAESMRTIQAASELLNQLLELPAPKEETTRITKVRWQIPWISTEWGPSLRNRFEQILYGLTVSQETPYIGLFTNRESGMQHKFWVKNVQTKQTHLPIPVWSAWVQGTRPQRDRPTLLLYNGADRSNFDRVAITATSLMITCYRNTTAKITLEVLQTKMLRWIRSLDALAAFVDPSDLAPSRWELQEISADLLYDRPIAELDMRRMPCLSSVFLANGAIFRLLRSDKTDRTLSDLEIAILQRLRQDETLEAPQIAEEMQIPVQQAAQTLENLRDRAREDPSILTQDLDVMPRLELGAKKTSIRNADDLERVVRYANLLRYVLTGSGKELDAVCPLRMEAVPAQSVMVATVPELEAPPTEAEDMDEFLGFLGSARAKGTADKDVASNYTLQRLRTLDPDTFDDQFSKKCELKRQPILMTPAQQERARAKGYDVLEEIPENQRMNLASGLVICPEYWCVTDEIPLRYDQLIEEQCPECGGDLRPPGTTRSLKEASVLVRDAAFKYPGYLKVLSKKNQQAMPCCYSTPQAAAPAADTSAMDAFYIMNETKRNLGAFRLAYLPAELMRRLRLPPDSYTKFRSENNRLKDKAQGVFRVGLGRVAKTLGDMLDLKVPRPRDAIPAAFQCPFVRTWREPAEDDGTFSTALAPFLPDTEARARMGRLLAGVDAAYEAGRLSPIQELEYVAYVTQTQVFRVHLSNQTITCGFGMDLFRSGHRAIAVLETDTTLDVLAYATHEKRSMRWVANLYQSPFVRSTSQVLEKASLEACSRSVPVTGDAVYAASVLGGKATFIVDPTGYAQAIWTPGQYILPIQPESVPPAESRRVDMSDIPGDQLPSYASQREAMETAASEAHPGFAWKRDHYDMQGQRVEVESESGFRAPVIPEAVGEGEPTEVTGTLRKGREAQLVEGAPNEADSTRAAEISYEAEVHDYLLFALSKDLRTKDWGDLRRAIEHANKEEVKPLLQDWYRKQITLVDVSKPEVFTRKVRAQCGQYTSEIQCTGVCAMNESGICKVRADHRKKDEEGTPWVFKRLLQTLLTNDKQRAVVLDGRSSPFFSTILYLELPHERFLTDAEIKWEKSQITE